MSDLRARILAATAELVAEHGVRAVSFRQVALRAGVSHQAPYHHFGDHRGILRALAREGFEALATAMREAARKAGADPRKALAAAGVAYVGFAQRHVGHFRVMFSRSLVDDAAEESAIPEAEATQAVLVELVRRVHASGHGLAVAADDLTLLCWSTVHGLATLMVEGLVDAKQGVPRAHAEKAAKRVVVALANLIDDR